MIENIVFLMGVLAGPIFFAWSVMFENRDREIEKQKERERFSREIGR